MNRYIYSLICHLLSKLYYGGLKIMEILECPLYKECKEEECPYFENEDCTYYIKKEQETE